MASEVPTRVGVLERLAATHEALARHDEQRAPIAEQRDQALLEAIDAGLTHARIAEALGVTRARVNQLVQAARRSVT